MDIQLQSSFFFQDPYPTYARMRSTEGPYWLGIENQTSLNGIWLFSRYEDALSIFKNSSTFSKNVRSVRLPQYQSPFDLITLHRDTPDHMRQRRLVADFFSTRSVHVMESRVTKLCSEHLDSLSLMSDVDIISEYADLIPLTVILDMMGIPLSDSRRIRSWSMILSDGFDSTITTPEVLQKHLQALREFLAYVKYIISKSKHKPKDDLLGYLVRAQEEGKLNDEELIAMVGFLIFAGHETTVGLIGNGILLLLKHTNQLDILRERPQLIVDAIEEILRFESPEQRSSFRVTTDSIVIGEMRVEKGQQVGVIIGSANRDERTFPFPDTFDISRKPNRHLAFGLGIHQCLGMHLARMQARISISAFIERFPTAQLSKNKPEWRKNSFFRSLMNLPVKLK